MFQGKSKVELGDFPPCPGVTSEEVDGIRSLTKYGDKMDKEQTDLLVKRDQSVLNVLGRVSNWCKAYHARIGFEETIAAPVEK